MDKREVLEKCCEEYMMKDDGTIDQALTELNKLELTEIIEIIRNNIDKKFSLFKNPIKEVAKEIIRVRDKKTGEK